MARICLAAIVLASSLMAFVLCICIIGVSPMSSSAAAICTGASLAVGPDQSSGDCSTESVPQSANTAPGTHGLPADYTIPPSASAAAAIAIAFAVHQLDKPYVFGAAGPNAYDCSGLTMAAWARAGRALPHSTLDQARVGSQTTRAE
ncbi:MAG: C40 family peptidase, partial [Actinomycetota bacterium]|nr:C40 family peptidase [Actinomycetota bacterium]